MTRIVRLKPATKRLKQVIRAHGEDWAVLQQKPIQAFRGATAVFVVPLHLLHSDDPFALFTQRWVRLDHVKEVTHAEA